MEDCHTGNLGSTPDVTTSSPPTRPYPGSTQRVQTLWIQKPPPDQDSPNIVVGLSTVLKLSIFIKTTKENLLWFLTRPNIVVTVLKLSVLIKTTKERRGNRPENEVLQQ